MSHIAVIPAKAGIQSVRLQRTWMEALDPRLRGDDEEALRGDDEEVLRGDDEEVLRGDDEEVLRGDDEQGEGAEA